MVINLLLYQFHCFWLMCCDIFHIQYTHIFSMLLSNLYKKEIKESLLVKFWHFYFSHEKVNKARWRNTVLVFFLFRFKTASIFISKQNQSQNECMHVEMWHRYKIWSTKLKKKDAIKAHQRCADIHAVNSTNIHQVLKPSSHLNVVSVFNWSSVKHVT